jgi:sarcosine oxidase subunit beta
VLVGAEIVPYASYSTRSTFEFLAGASRRTIRILPFLANARAMRQWGGSCDMTPDSSPILGPTGIEDLSLIAGMGTWGFKGAPVFGATMAEHVATGRIPALIRPFGLERFRADRMVPDAASAGTH